MAKQYIHITLRWVWLIILATVLASSIAYMVGKNQSPLYEVSARLIVGPGIRAVNPNLNDMRAAAQLMRTYAEFATTQPILQQVIDDLNLPLQIRELKSLITVNSDETTLLLTIRVRSHDAAQTVAIANALANSLVRMSPSSAGSLESQIKASISDQIKKLEQDLSTAEAEIEQQEANLQTMADSEARRLLEEQIAQKLVYATDTRNTLATLYTGFQVSYTNQVEIVELANNAAEVDSNLDMLVLLAGLATLILTVAIIFAFEYFNDAIKRPEDLSRAAAIPLLGTIAKHKSLSGQGSERLVVRDLPGSRTAENYRMLGSKILLSRYTGKNQTNNGDVEEQALAPAEPISDSVTHSLRSIVLSSIQTSDDISEIVANLAVVLAQTGQRVILVDAYLHRPTIGQRFGIISDEEGLTAVIGGWVSKAKPRQVPWLPNLSILPSGPIPTNPFELLASNRMAILIQELERQADIVLIATSPLLSFADSIILASRTDGVVIVVRSGTSSRDMVRNTVESLRSLNAHTIGAIFDYNRSTHVPSFVPEKTKGPGTMQPANSNQHPIAALKSVKL